MPLVFLPVNRKAWMWNFFYPSFFSGGGAGRQRNHLVMCILIMTGFCKLIRVESKDE